jgi:Carboxypeptidase regulatory-like domain
MNRRLLTINAFVIILLAGFVFIPLSPVVLAQTTVSSGSIQGTVTDPSGAVVSGANVTITNRDTGQVIRTTTSPSGLYTSGGLVPGTYLIRTEASGFKSVQQPVTVAVGVTTNGNMQLSVGQGSETVEVQGSSIAVNTDQAEVQGVLTAAQIENLPVNGRNFLDLAQLEPGVQIQDGQNFDPTKAGYSSISFGGRFGRTARIYVDGVDISDETVGTTTADIPASAIDEFQLAQSSLDLSNDLTSSGAINVTTKSGTNTYHGQAFGFIRDHSFGANAPGGVDQYMQRDQYGGRFGGPVIKDKLFFFADGERTKQDAQAGVLLSGTPFANFTGAFGQPFRENNLLGRVDYNLHNGKLFYRYSYFSNSLFATFGLGYAVYDNKDYTRQHVVGWDFNTGSSMTHSIRFTYLKFQNQIVDATLNNPALPDCCTGLLLSSGSFFVGPNLLAPQSTPQSNRQIKYDGTKIFHNHTIRYGASFNHVQGGGFADFYGTAPRVSWTTSGGPNGTEAFAAGGPFPGGASNPLNYPVNRLRVGNGQGFATTEPALGFPAGGLGPDNRIGFYVGDNWKVKPNFTLAVGVRYNRDTGRTDSDLPAIPEINAAFPGWGNAVHQANLNFAPQIGIAWDPTKSGKTVIRAGIGMYYEDVIWNNVLFDRPERERTGAFNAVTSACLGGVAQQVPVASGFISPAPGICGNNVAVGTVIPQILSFWQQVLAGNPFNTNNPNPNFVGTSLAAGLGVPGPALFGPNYKTPVSVQMNFGIQHQIRNGMVFSADYLRNVETRTLLGIDVNNVGDVSTFNLGGAQTAIANTNAAFGCPADFAASSIDCAILAGASMSDFAAFGLGTPNDVAGVGCNQPVTIGGIPTGGLGYPCAFGGKNSLQNQAFFLQPVGRSVYNALQLKLTQNMANPVRGVKSVNFQVAYSLSRFDNTGGAQLTGTPADNDQDFVLQAADNNNPGRYFGPSLLDRTHQLSFGGYADVPGGFRVAMISHFYSPLSSGLIAPNFGSSGEIFRTDFTGDGTFGDPIPGTHLGEFDRGVDASNLNKTLTAYNTNTANTATPAGNALINHGLMTLPQLQALGGVAPHICLAPPAVDTDPSCSSNTPGGTQQNYNWLRAFDFTLAWRHTFLSHSLSEGLTIEPSVGIYNLFNFANFNLPPNTMNGLLTGPGSGAINGTTRSDLEAFRVGNGTGVYSLGSQRQLEFGLKLDF